MIFSSYKIIGDIDNLSIEYKNLYYINQKFYYFTDNKEINLPYVNKFTNTYGWKPEIVYFNNLQELKKHLLQYTFENINIGAIADNLWYGNIGHALWDGFYPIYVALVKFGYENKNFVLFTSDWHNKKTMSYDVITKFSGNLLREYSKEQNNIIFDVFVAGTGSTGNRVMSSDYTLYGEKEYNALTLFKQRLLQSYDIKIDKPINTKLKAIIINNKRYSSYEIDIIKEVVNKYKNDERIDIKFIDWYHHYKSFADQLKELEDVDIHITGPGTGMMYMPFLKKGAVNINLGYIEHTQTNTARPNIKIDNTTKSDFLVPGYMEQSVCAATNYVSTIYYDRYQYNNIEINPLIDSIEYAIDVAKGNKKAESNHFKDAQIYIEYCKRCHNPKQVVDYLTGIAFFIELFINEHPVAIKSNVIDIDLLRKIKEEFGFSKKYEIKL